MNAQKQASAFPPNFIHSLDATHMMLTALECRVSFVLVDTVSSCSTLSTFQSRGLTFASVHDSYWTHASCVNEMSGVIRDTFIALHSSDVLGKLEEEVRSAFLTPLFV